MNYSDHFNFYLPEGRDAVDISKINYNFTKLDSMVQEIKMDVTLVNGDVNILDGRVDSVESNLTSTINSMGNQRKPVIGTYTGNGSASRSITLGFRPTVVIVMGLRDGMHYQSASIATSQTAGAITHGTVLSTTSTGFTVYYTQNYVLSNLSGVQFLYAAWR